FTARQWQTVPASAEAPASDALALKPSSLQKIEVRRFREADDKAHLGGALAIAGGSAASPLSGLAAVHLSVPNYESYHLERTGDAWVMEGNWPTRAAEVAHLIEVLTTLKSRFEPIRTEGDGADLHGTDRPAVEVTVETTDKTKHVLKFSDRT